MKKLLFVVLALLLCTTLVTAEEPIYDHFVYLPLVTGPDVPTPTPAEPSTPTATPAPICDCSGNIYNCSDFTTQAAAQQCYNWCMLQEQDDVHNLDADSDGIACESLMEIPAVLPTPGTVVLPTATPTPNTDRVALLADTQNANLDGQQQIVASLATRSNDILVMAGDVTHLCDCYTEQCADARYQEQFDVLEPLGSLEWHLSPGNHEYCERQDLTELGITMWEKWVGDRYHTFNTTYACFFMVDDQVWDAEQAQWLDEVIAQCDKPWKILVKHFPMPHSVEPNPGHEWHPGRYAGLDIDLIVAGHTHCFTIWKDEQVLNIVLPAASRGLLWDKSPYIVTGDEVITPFPVPAAGFGELEIGPTTLTWRVFRFDGLLLLEGDLQ